MTPPKIPALSRPSVVGAIASFILLSLSSQELTDRAAAETAKVSYDRLSHLTPRERQVLPYVIAGKLNKQIAGTLGTVEKTIKVHRARMMQKLGVRTVQDLVRLAERVGIDPARAA